ncbi:hypothetical protein BDB01DRAFT_792315 [Pilobolus umbonatus]|nr:hypothetical protein BDB01DRAFT_792315 [Pilobolus umbonatus]
MFYRKILLLQIYQAVGVVNVTRVFSVFILIRYRFSVHHEYSVVHVVHDLFPALLPLFLTIILRRKSIMLTISAGGACSILIITVVKKICDRQAVI